MYIPEFDEFLNWIQNPYLVSGGICHLVCHIKWTGMAMKQNITYHDIHLLHKVVDIFQFVQNNHLINVCCLVLEFNRCKLDSYSTKVYLDRQIHKTHRHKEVIYQDHIFPIFVTVGRRIMHVKINHVDFERWIVIYMHAYVQNGLCIVC